MTDTSRKRSRKSKLVPRECIEDDDIELEITSQLYKSSKKIPETVTSADVIPEIAETPERTEAHTSILKRIKALPKETVESISPRKFEVNIEVETCSSDDDFFAIDTEKDKLTKSDIILNPKSLSRELILKTAEEITENTTNEVDKIINIWLRNAIDSAPVTPIQTLHEALIQTALDEWRTWQFKSFHREAPLFYKCYLCKMSWWTLSDFRDHIQQHTDIKIALEKRAVHECNIIAHKRNTNGNDFYTAGLCHRCGSNYDDHKLSSRSSEKYQGKNGCIKDFYSCSGWNYHRASCELCNDQKKPVKCNICKLCFESADGLSNHLTLSHTVRSDIPIMSRYIACKVCSERYIYKHFHKCNKERVFECPHCFINFSDSLLMKSHLENSHKYECTICGHQLKRECEKYKHMLQHTDKYILVSMCKNCVGFKVFLHNDDLISHHKMNHKSGKIEEFFPKLIVPTSCIEEDLVGRKIPKTEESHLEIKSELLQEQSSEFTRAFFGENIKEEPIDEEDNPRPVIKQEPMYETDEENQTGNMNPQIKIKEELLDEEEYEEDIIKLNFDISEVIVKEESQETYDCCGETQELSEDEKCPKSTRLYTCKKCGYTAKHKLYKIHIENDCGTDISKRFHPIHSCTKCKKSFEGIKNYLAHFVQHGYNHLSCPECLKQYHHTSNLTQHFYTHVKSNFVRVKLITQYGKAQKEPNFQCKKCGLDVVPEDFFQHWELHINDKPTMPIIVTSAEPKTAKDVKKAIVLKECISRLQTQPKDCNICFHHFNRVNECKRHIIEHLLSDAYSEKHIYQELRCQICGSGFVSPEKYKSHMRTHASLPVYKCELCDRTFSDSSNFTKHKKVHNLKVSVCDLCGKKFQSKVSLAQHMEKHKKTDPVNCTICDKIFYFESAYRRHVRYYHEKSCIDFRCVICSMRFPTLKLKWDHMWEVHKERKHKADCPICSKSFRKYSDVRSHSRKTHGVEVSVFSVKNAAKLTEMKLSEIKPSIGVPETLVVYESD